MTLLAGRMRHFGLSLERYQALLACFPLPRWRRRKREDARLEPGVPRG
jgi:hypothetical protein